jgi:hypothetical protein
MYRWGMPLGCLSLMAAILFGVLVLGRLDGGALWVGVGVLAVFGYSALMCVHYFESSPAPRCPRGAQGRGGRP